MGGGFNSYLIDHVELPGTDDNPGSTQFGRAFHSIYFEMLGEQGYPGLIMFLTVAASTFWKLRRVSRKARAHPDLAWLAGRSDAVQCGLLVFMTAGAFLFRVPPPGWAPAGWIPPAQSAMATTTQASTRSRR